ncbi:MAG: ABC transporter permease subunit [Bacillaceae bacterium]|nr:ABC transporter permease subunit [Bacillaceae bacterium]
MKKHNTSVNTPFWRDNRIIPIILQAIFAILLILAFVVLINNTIKGMEKIGINLGFGFLEDTASFSIGESLIDYQPTDSYAKAVLVGILNTIKVSVIGIILATIIGVVVGVTRLSNNWLARQVAGLYIEVLRNTPLLVQIFIWYYAVFLNLPKVQESFVLFDSVYISNRGVALPWFDPTSATNVWIILFIIGIISSIILWKVKIKAEAETGERKYPLIWAAGSLIGALTLAAIITQQGPAAMNYPAIGKFNFTGGQVISPEFSAILVSLTLYTATYIAEIVRGGILSVSKGQTEASKALGLKNSTMMRLVIFPQAFRVIIPPVTSQYLNLTKNSSLAVAVAYPDLVSVGNTILNQTGRAVEMITVMILVYLTISLLTSLFMNLFNKKMQLVER